MIETTEYVMDSGIVTTYGVSCSSGGAGDGRDQACDQIIPNISTRPSFVEELVDRLNIHNAAPVHLKDLIDDFLP
jgi:hypothetical protein